MTLHTLNSLIALVFGVAFCVFSLLAFVGGVYSVSNDEERQKTIKSFGGLAYPIALLCLIACLFSNVFFFVVFPNLNFLLRY